MPKIKYYFDSKTLTFKLFKPDTTSRLKKFGAFIAISLVSAVVIILQRKEVDIISLLSSLRSMTATEKSEPASSLAKLRPTIPPPTITILFIDTHYLMYITHHNNASFIFFWNCLTMIQTPAKLPF